MGRGRRGAVLTKKVRDSVSDKDRFEQKPEGKEGTTKIIWAKSVPGRDRRASIKSLKGLLEEHKEASLAGAK